MSVCCLCQPSKGDIPPPSSVNITFPRVTNPRINLKNVNNSILNCIDKSFVVDTNAKCIGDKLIITRDRALFRLPVIHRMICHSDRLDGYGCIHHNKCKSMCL